MWSLGVRLAVVSMSLVYLLAVVVVTAPSASAAPATPKVRVKYASADPLVLVRLPRRALPTEIEILIVYESSQSQLFSFRFQQQRTRQDYLLSGIPQAPGTLMVRQLKSDRSYPWSSPIELAEWDQPVNQQPDDKPAADPTNTTKTNCAPNLTREVLTQVNYIRVANSLAPLAFSAELEQSAQIHSNLMASRQSLSHDNWLAEILAAGFSGNSLAQNIASHIDDSFSLVHAWMQSPTHRSAILRPTLAFSGVGCAVDSDGAKWWTQNFGG